MIDPLPIYITGKPAGITAQFEAQHRGELAARLAASAPLRNKRAVEEFQAAALYHFAHCYVGKGALALEIGTAQGYSASLIAPAIYPGKLITLNPNIDEAVLARQNLREYSNVTVVEEKSVNYLPGVAEADTHYDFIFVDGDHKRVVEDFPYFNRLKPGGLILFHDWSPWWSPRACIPVYRHLVGFTTQMNHDFDVVIVDDQQVGMVGFVRREGETYVPVPLVS